MLRPNDTGDKLTMDNLKNFLWESAAPRNSGALEGLHVEQDSHLD